MQTKIRKQIAAAARREVKRAIRSSKEEIDASPEMIMRVWAAGFSNAYALASGESWRDVYEVIERALCITFDNLRDKGAIE